MSIHQGYPYLRVSDGAAALAWYCAVFGARELFRLTDPENGRLGHAELEFGPNVVIMLSSAYPEMGIGAPSGEPGQAVHLHVDDADALMAKALDAGATCLRPVRTQFYGERGGSFRDPWGHEWMVGHEVERVDPAEMQRRWDEMVRGA